MPAFSRAISGSLSSLYPVGLDPEFDLAARRACFRSVRYAWGYPCAAVSEDEHVTAPRAFAVAGMICTISPVTDPLQGSAFFDRWPLRRPILRVRSRAVNSTAIRVLYRKRGDQFVDTLPFPLTRDVLDARPRTFQYLLLTLSRPDGDGNGMIVQRGFTHPPACTPASGFADAAARPLFRRDHERVRGNAQLRSRVSPHDRWAIAAYIRVLQVSRSATVSDVPPA